MTLSNRLKSPLRALLAHVHRLLYRYAVTQWGTSMATMVPKARRGRRAATSAERQAVYRRRHLNEVDTVDCARLNFIIPVAAKRALERLSKRYAVTQRDMLRRLIGDAERAATDGMPTAELRRYYGDAIVDRISGAP